MKRTLGKILSAVVPGYWKKYAELAYWKKQKKREGKLTNKHYSYFYKEHFGLSDKDYRNKRILDIGCGPRGSLEWANQAKVRIGIDPLADEYLKLGAERHKMDYVTAPAEQMPFEDSYFNIVCSFNSLDHVEDIEKTISEIKRVTKPGGLFLLLVEINHEPTNCEPHTVTPEIIQQFEPEFLNENCRIYLPEENNGLYESIRGGVLADNPSSFKKQGWLSVRFTKKKEY